MSWRRRLGENLPYKIVALVVAVLVWFYVTESLEFEKVVDVPLRLVNLPPNTVLVGKAPSQVSARVRARGRFIGLRTKGLLIPVDLSGAQVGQVSRLLSPADVEVPPGVRAEVLRIISPGVVTVEIDSLLTRTIPVVTALRGTPAEGYLQAGMVLVNPPRVKVQGPKQYVRGLEALPTHPVSLEQARETVTTRAGVSLNGLPGVIGIPDVVTVTVPVEKVEVFDLSPVPVRIEVADPLRRVSWEPERVKLELRGARSLFEKWHPHEMVLVIEASTLSPGYYEYVAEPLGRDEVRLVPFSVGPPLPSPGPGVREHRELRGKLPLPEFLELASLAPHTFHILVE